MSTELKFRSTFQVIIIFLFSGSVTAMGLIQKDSSELHQQALDQTDEIDLIFELLAEAANKGKLNNNNEKDSLASFGKIRKVISAVKDTDSDNLPKILGTNEMMIRSLEFMTNNNFNTIPTINNTSMMARRLPKPLSLLEAQEKLQVNEQKLEKVQKKFENIGLSPLNIITRRSEKLIKKFSVHKTVYRLAPYGLILLYMAYVTRVNKIENITGYLPKALAGAINSIKRFIGTAPYIKQEAAGKAPEVHDRTQFESGQMSEIHTILQTGNFLKIEIEPLLKWAPATFLVGLVTKDWKDLTTAVKKRIKRVYSKLKHETVYEETVFSKPMLNPNSLDLLDASEFKNIKNFFKYKNLFDLADHSIDQSYLFVGAPTTGYYTVDILCAQLSRDLTKDCRIVRLHASDFVPPKKLNSSTFDKEDKITQVVTNAKKHDISFVVIENIDWIYQQKERTIARLDKFLDDASKKSNIIVIALTNNPDKVSAHGNNTLTKIHIDNLNYEQRLKFIKSQLRADHAVQDIGIEDIAKQTENYNLGDLKRIVQYAYTLAYTEHKPFNKKHLALSTANFAKK